MRLLRPEEVSYLAACSRATIDRRVADGVLPSVTLHRGEKKRTYRFRATDIARIFGITIREIEEFIAAEDRKTDEKKRERVVEKISHANGTKEWRGSQ